MNAQQTTALVTGATSGLGFETAVHLADAGYTTVAVTGRTRERAAAAVTGLIERTGKDIFVPIELDLNVSQSVRSAVRALVQDVDPLDALILNAGMVSGPSLVLTDEDVEITFASSIDGHHQLVAGLLEANAIASNARIVIAGSEAARGDVPTFNPTDLHSYAAKHFDNDLDAAAESLIRHDGPLKYKPATAYANAKLFVAYWAAQLAPQLPAGTTVNAVSPGSAPNTDAGRNANFFMRRIMMPTFKLAPKRLGMAATTPDAAMRYVDALSFGPGDTGNFYASAPKKMTGDLHRVLLDHVTDEVAAQAAYTATTRVAGVMVHVGGSPAGTQAVA